MAANRAGAGQRLKVVAEVNFEAAAVRLVRRLH
jgi:hypothetical protein